METDKHPPPLTQRSCVVTGWRLHSRFLGVEVRDQLEAGRPSVERDLRFIEGSFQSIFRKQISLDRRTYGLRWVSMGNGLVTLVIGRFRTWLFGQEVPCSNEFNPPLSMGTCEVSGWRPHWLRLILSCTRVLQLLLERTLQNREPSPKRSNSGDREDLNQRIREMSLELKLNQIRRDTPDPYHLRVDSVNLGR